MTPLHKKLNVLKLDDIYSLELGKIMHKFHSGNLPDNFNHLFTPVNQVHCHATRSATRGASFWQMARNKYGKWSLKHPGAKIRDNIDPSVHDSSRFTFEKHYRDLLISAYDDRYMEFFMSTVADFILPIAHFFFQIAHFPLIMFHPPIAIFIPYFS